MKPKNKSVINLLSVSAAVNDCSHVFDDPLALNDCINDILGATDCQVCICDVLPFLC